MTLFKDRAVLLLALGQTLGWGATFYLFPVLLLSWETAEGWAKTELTGAITLAVLVAAVLSPFAGRLIDRGQGAVMTGAGALVASGGLGVLAQATTLWQFYLAWLILGAAMTACLYEPCFALVTRARGAEAKRGIIAITLIAGFASTISYPILHWLAETFGWRTAVLVAAATAACIVAPVNWLGAKVLEREGVADLADLAGAQPSHNFLRSFVFWGLAIGFALMGTVHGALVHHLFPLMDERGVTAGTAVFVASLLGPMQVVGRFFMMVTANVLSHHGITVSTFVGMGVSVIVLAMAGASTGALVLFIMVFGGAYGMTSVIRPVIARDMLGGQNFGAKAGALAVPYLIGAALAPYLGALIWAGLGYDRMLTVLLLVQLTGFVVYLAAHRRAVVMQAQYC